jgi:outer membrane protein assembly factor BamA
MNVNDVITKLRIMLGAEEEVVETVTETMSESTLVDGTVVYSEGELAPGAVLYVKVEEGEAPFAPEGMHETTDGLLVTVGENGEIASIEEKATEEVAAEEKVEEVEMEEEEPKAEVEIDMDAKELIEAIAGMIKPQAEVIEELKEEIATLKAKFSELADEPAGEPVRNTFSEERADKLTKAEARLSNLIAIRKGK